MDRVQMAADGSAGLISMLAGIFSWLLRDASVDVFGVPASVLLAGFAGAMAIVSFLPPFETRRKMWSTVLICTLAAVYLTKIALKIAGWDGGHALGMAFIVGFSFQLVGQFIVQHSKQLLEALLARIRGGA